MLTPDQLAVIYRAFDTAWNETAKHYETSPDSIEAGRLRLANAVFTGYRNGVTDPMLLKDAAVHSMALGIVTHRAHRRSSPGRKGAT